MSHDVTNSEPRPRILALDVGFANCGLVIFRGGRAELATVITTTPVKKKRGIRKADDDSERCAKLARGIHAAIIDYGVRVIVAEMPSAGAQGARANRCMGMAAAIVVTLAEIESLPLVHVTPAEGKRATTGKNNGSKADVQAAVRKRFPRIGVLLDAFGAKAEHAADAAAAYMAAENDPVIRMIG